MKKILNAKVHPTIIILFASPLFWFLVVIVIYLVLMMYWCSKLFFIHDRVLRVEDVVVTATGNKVAARLWRKKNLGLIWHKIRPFAKR